MISKQCRTTFADYDTTVHFISEEELKSKPQWYPTWWICDSVAARQVCNKEHNHIIEYSLKLDSNPEFTAICSGCICKSSIQNETGRHEGLQDGI